MTETIILPGEVKTTFKIYGENEFDVIRTQDVEPYLEANKEFRNSGMDGYTPSRDMKHVAQIPVVVFEKWAREAGIHPFSREMNEVVRKKLNDPEYAYLRTGGGRI